MNFLVLETLACLLFVACGHSQHMVPRKYKVLTLDDTQIPCSRNMACRLAICLWAPIPVISEETCTMLDNTCTCPRGQICSISDNYTPRHRLVTFEYRCRSSADLFGSKSFRVY